MTTQLSNFEFLHIFLTRVSFYCYSTSYLPKTVQLTYSKQRDNDYGMYNTILDFNKNYY